MSATADKPSAHTAGDWYIDRDVDQRIIVGSDKEQDAVPSRNGGIYLAHFLGPDRLANATLFIAAPALLQTVKDLVGLAAMRPGKLGDYKAALDDARALVERAEGRV